MTWRPVIDPLGRGYTPGFDEERLYQFKREGDGKIRSFRMADQSHYFNVGGLYFRDPLTELRQG